MVLEQGKPVVRESPEDQGQSGWFHSHKGFLTDKSPFPESLLKAFVHSDLLSNLCVGYAEYSIDNPPGDRGIIIGVPSEPAPHDTNSTPPMEPGNF